MLTADAGCKIHDTGSWCRQQWGTRFLNPESVHLIKLHAAERNTMSDLTFAKIDQTVLNTLEPPRRSYWGAVALLALGVLLGAGAWTYQIFTGIGVGGQNIPVVWGTYLINFVFWVGIAHSGTLISAILHLFRAGWRNPIARAAETMTVFAVCTAGLFPFIHLGRVWQVYYMLPIPNQRLLWPNFLSPLMFDVVAISTYLTVSSLFWYTGLLPDLALIRDRSTGRRHRIFRVLSLGWTGAHTSGSTTAAATSSSPRSRPRSSSRCTASSPGTLRWGSCRGGTRPFSPRISWPAPSTRGWRWC